MQSKRDGSVIGWGGFCGGCGKGDVGSEDRMKEERAADGIRTHDNHVGNVMLCQLSYSRMMCPNIGADYRHDTCSGKAFPLGGSPGGRERTREGPHREVAAAALRGPIYRFPACWSEDDPDRLTDSTASAWPRN